MYYEELPTFFADIFFAIMKYNPKYVMLTIFFQALSNSSNTGKKGMSRSAKAQLGSRIFNQYNQNIIWPYQKDQIWIMKIEWFQILVLDKLLGFEFWDSD